MIWPAVSGTSCTFGLGTAPQTGSLNHGGKVFALFDGNGGPHYLSHNGFVHELGHNFGLGHSHGVYCPDGNGEFENGQGCTHDEYGDFFDTMGRVDDGNTPQISTAAKDKLGVLDRTVTTQTVTGGSHTFTIEGLRLDPAANAGDGGLESVKVIDPDNGRPYYIEYRSQSTDWRANVTGGWTNFPNTHVMARDNQGNALWPRPQTSDYGVRIIRIGTHQSQGGHQLAGGRLGMNPISNITNSLTRQSWKPGDVFETRTGKIRIEVLSANEASAQVRVLVRDSVGPVFSGVADRTVEAKSVESFDPLAGVTAHDAGDGDVTESIQVSGQVNMGQPGTYVLDYSVTDSSGNTTTKQRTIRVLAPVVIDPVDPDGGNPGDGDGANDPDPSGAPQIAATDYISSYGRALTIPIRVAGTPPSNNGQIAVSIGQKNYGTVVARQGRASVTLPATLKKGKHRVVLTFTSEGPYAPTTQAITVRITKARTKAVIKVNRKKIKAGKGRLKVTVRLKAPGSSVKTRGKVRVLVAGKRVATVKIPASAKKRTVKLKANVFRRDLVGKKAKVRIKYLGTKNFKKSRSKTVRVLVR
ncbi:protein of unknown function [Micrococcales bacterium KH10]|nr:protein of unknown function [Micrococcales bacterium KH10]